MKAELAEESNQKKDVKDKIIGEKPFSCRCWLYRVIQRKKFVLVSFSLKLFCIIFAYYFQNSFIYIWYQLWILLGG